MGIIIKYLIRNILEKKLRSFLIVLTITLSTALLFASLAITDTAANIYIKQVRSSFGESELVIQPNDRSPARYFTVAFPDIYQDSISYTIGVVETGALYRHQKKEAVILNAKGFDWEDIQLMGPISLKRQTGLFPFTGSKVIISDHFGQKYNLRTGEVLKLDINQKRYRFIIAAIANRSGLFTQDNNLMIIPKTKLGAICSQIGNVSRLYIKLKNPEDKQRLTTELSKFITRYDVRETISEEELEESTETVTMALNLTMIIIIFLTIFIVYTSFKVITAERLPLIGTFRSIGANKRTTDLILLGEAGAYGIIGGIIGCILGIIVLYLMGMAMAESSENAMVATGPISLTFSAAQLGIAFLMAIILAMASAALPVIKVSKLPIKDVILNMVQQQETSLKTWKLILGIFLVGMILAIPPLLEGDLALVFDTLCIGMAVVACVMIVPFLTTGMLKICEPYFRRLFGSVGILAVKNLRGNKNAQNSIVLISISIATILMVSTFGVSVVSGMINFTQKSILYDFSFSLPRMDRIIERSVRSTTGVKAVQGRFIIEDVIVLGSTERIGELHGVDSAYLDFQRITGISGDLRETRKLIEKLNYGRNIIISDLLKNIYGLKKGDSLTLRFNNKDFTYKVIGFVNTIEQGGRFAMIAKRYFKMDTGEKFYTELAVKTNIDPKSVLHTLIKKYDRSLPSGFTIQEFLEEDILKEISGLITILNGFSILTALICLIGLVNNLIVNFLAKKHSLAVLCSVGATRVQTVKIVLIEAVTSGIIGSIIGICFGLIMISIIPNFTRAIVAVIPAQFSITNFIVTGIGGVLVTLVASASPVFKTSKLNIVESIKYE